MVIDTLRNRENRFPGITGDIYESLLVNDLLHIQTLNNQLTLLLAGLTLAERDALAKRDTQVYIASLLSQSVVGARHCKP